MITISSTEYFRLINNDVQLIKYKTICTNKANEIKILRTQLAYFKKQAMKRKSEVPQGDEGATADEFNVN